MSNIPLARDMIEAVIQCIDVPSLKRQLRKAVSLMTREKYIRHARPVSQVITDEMKAKVHKLHENLNLTETDIARRTGLRNAGRVSEILNGKR